MRLDNSIWRLESRAYTRWGFCGDWPLDANSHRIVMPVLCVCGQLNSIPMEVDTLMQNSPLALTWYHVLEDAVVAYLGRVSNKCGIPVGFTTVIFSKANHLRAFADDLEVDTMHNLSKKEATIHILTLAKTRGPTVYRLHTHTPTKAYLFHHFTCHQWLLIRFM